MQRYNLNMKSGTYTQSNAYNLVPIYRQQVVPGQTIDLDAQVSMKTASFTKLLTTPALASIWFFYVPHRLIWDGWTSFISKEEGASTFPVTNQLSAKFFDEALLAPGETIDMSPLYRRAYKLCYNEYFGDDSNQMTVTDDSTVTLGGLKNPEQFLSKVRAAGEVVDPEFTVTANSIPLNEFYRAQMNARSKQRSQMTGDKYVDTLARMGVDATWMISERPEFLGTKSKLCAPQLFASSEAATLGQEVSRFNCPLSVQLKKKHFAEHGYIVGVAGFRPLVMWLGRGATDMVPGNGTLTPTDENWLDMFYTADNTQTKDQVFDKSTGLNDTDDTNFTQRFGYLKNGAWINGDGSDWSPIGLATDWDDLRYPARTYDFINTDELSGSELAFTSSMILKGKTPVPNHVA